MLVWEAAESRPGGDKQRSPSGGLWALRGATETVSSLWGDLQILERGMANDLQSSRL